MTITFPLFKLETKIKTAQQVPRIVQQDVGRVYDKASLKENAAALKWKVMKSLQLWTMITSFLSKA